MDFETSMLRYNMAHVVRIGIIVKVRNPVMAKVQDLTNERDKGFADDHAILRAFPRRALEQKLGKSWVPA